MTVAEGPDVVTHIRQAMEEVSGSRIVIFTTPGSYHSTVGNFTPPSPGQEIPSPLRGEGQGGGLASVVAVPITDTCKEVVDGLVRRTIPRDSLVEARGPWMFDRDELLRALDAASTAKVTNLVDLSRAAHLRVRVLIQP